MAPQGLERPRLGPGSAGGRGSRRAPGRARRCGAGQHSHLGGAAGLQHVLLHRHGPARLPAAPRARRAGDGGGWAGPGLGERSGREEEAAADEEEEEGREGEPESPPGGRAAEAGGRHGAAPIRSGPAVTPSAAAAAQRAQSAAPPPALPPRLPAAAPPRAPASPEPRCPYAGRPPRGYLAGGTAGSACLHLGGGVSARSRRTARPETGERPRCPAGLGGVSARGLRFPRFGAAGDGSYRSLANARGRTGSVRGLAAATPTCSRRLSGQRLLGGRCPDTGPEDALRFAHNV